MRLDILHVPDCPNLAVLVDRLGEVTELPVTTRAVNSEAEAVASGMSGSPTLLINGSDPFADASRSLYGVTCRLYRDTDGRIVPAPSVDQLRDAITAARTLDPSPSPSPADHPTP